VARASPCLWGLSGAPNRPRRSAAPDNTMGSPVFGWLYILTGCPAGGGPSPLSQVTGAVKRCSLQTLLVIGEKLARKDRQISAVSRVGQSPRSVRRPRLQSRATA
jgi:hypothetical protein